MAWDQVRWHGMGAAGGGQSWGRGAAGLRQRQGPAAGGAVREGQGRPAGVRGCCGAEDQGYATGSNLCSCLRAEHLPPGLCEVRVCTSMQLK